MIGVGPANRRADPKPDIRHSAVDAKCCDTDSVDHLTRMITVAVSTCALAVVAVSCGGSSDGAEGADSAVESGGVVSTETPSAGGTSAANGEQLARSNGCAGCHGQDFGGGAGPGLVGLAGSEVALVDGGTIVADTAYLTRSIAEPSADLVADYTLKMPANGLSDAEIADIVDYIETLADG